jgi:hypothetical protein
MESVPKSLGEIISRTVLGLVSIGLLFGGLKCFHAASAMANAYNESHPYTFHDPNQPVARDSTSGILVKVGWALISVGFFAGVASIAPLSVIERFYSPPQF